MPRGETPRSTRALMERFAEKFDRLERQVKDLQSRSSMRNVSIDDAGLEFTRDGRVVGVVGRQRDGSQGSRVFDSGPQPRPTSAEVEGGSGVLSIGWDGYPVAGDVPEVFGRVEAWGAMGDNPTFDDAMPLAAIYSREGGSSPARVQGGNWTIWLVMVGADGQTRSIPSDPVKVEVDDPLSDWDISDRLDKMADGDLEDGFYERLMARSAEFVRLRAENLEAGAVRGEHFDVGALDGQIITGAAVQTNDHPTLGSKMTDEGFFGYDSDGRSTTVFNGEQARIAAPETFIDGDVSARSLSLEGALTIGADGEGRILPAADGRLRQEGRIPDDAGPRDSYTVGTTPYLTADGAGDFSVTITYAEPAPSGARLPVITPNYPNSYNGRAHVQFNTQSRRAESFTVQGRVIAAATQDRPRISFTYNAFWGSSA